MTYYCICTDELDSWCPEHGDDVEDLRKEFGHPQLPATTDSESPVSELDLFNPFLWRPQR